MGNLVKEIAPNDYDEAKNSGSLAGTMAGMGYAYDSMNRRIFTYSPDNGIIQAVSYDGNGNVKKVSDGLRYTGDMSTSPGTEYTYDGLGRAVGITDALGNKTAYEYNVLGSLTRQTDARGNSTRYEYNSDGTLGKVIDANGGEIEYVYDRLGRKTSVKDQRGNVTAYRYNAFGKVKTETDPYNFTVEYKYDLNGNAALVKDKKGSTSSFTYDANNRLIEKKTPLDKDGSGNTIYATEKYNYDEAGNITKKTMSGTRDKALVRDTYYTYYGNNLVKTASDSGGSFAGYYYDKNGNAVKIEKLKETDAEGNPVYDVEKFEYDRMNRLVKDIKLADGEDIYGSGSLAAELADAEYLGKVRIITGYEYDRLGNKTQEISPKGDTVTFTYDILNRLEKVIRKVNGSDAYYQYFYDEEGNTVKERNERGFEKETTYTVLNKPHTVKDALGNTYTYTYDLAGNKETETNAKGYTITYSYDKLNRLETITDPYNVVIGTRRYDANGNLEKEFDAKGNAAAYTYDLAGRLIKAADREGNESVYEYNPFGEQIKVVDGMQNATLYEYDAAGRLLKVTDANGISVSYAYDKIGNKLFMTDGRGKVTSYLYGAFRMLRSVKDADDKAISYKYDLAGNVASVTDRNGNNTVYTYDSRNLLAGKEVLETGEKISFIYDEAGNRAAMTDESGTSEYTYDASNMLLEIRKDEEVQISYTYDVLGNISTVTDKKGYVTAYTYDRSSRMETVSFDGRTVSYKYDISGNRESITYDGGVKEEYGYDKNNRVTRVTNRGSSGVISEYTYTYDAAGRQASKTDSYGITRYGYDAAGRVLRVEAPGKTTVYAYDGAGNRVTQNETYTSAQPTEYIDEASGEGIQYILKKTDYAYSNANKLLKTVEWMYDAENKEVLRKTVMYYYDGNGNQLSQVASYIHPHNQSLRQSTRGSLGSIDPLIERVNNTFDGFNRLKKAENVKGGVRTVTEYLYNGDNLRVRKTVKSSDKQYAEAVTNYLYDRQHVVLETDGNDTLIARYVRGINYIARTSSGSYSYFMYNGHGDVVQTVDENGSVENSYDYDIWGNMTLEIERYSNSIRYAGEFFDKETGLYYLRARYYDPYIGRFISEDSYWGEDTNPLSLNLYTYTNNDPVNFVDPTGHWEEGDTQLSKKNQKRIKNLTKKYEEAEARGDKDTMNEAHAAAVAIRTKKGSGIKDYKDEYNYYTTEKNSGSSKKSSDSGSKRDPVEQTRLRIVSTEYAYKDKLISKDELKQSVGHSLASLQKTFLDSGKANSNIGAQYVEYLSFELQERYTKSDTLSVTQSILFDELPIFGIGEKGIDFSKYANSYQYPGLLLASTSNNNIFTDFVDSVKDTWKEIKDWWNNAPTFEETLRENYGVGDDNSFADDLYLVLPKIVQSKIDIWKDNNKELLETRPDEYKTKYANEVLNFYDATTDYEYMFKAMDEAIDSGNIINMLAAGIVVGGVTGAKTKLKAANLPTTGKIRFVPPKKWTPSQELSRTSDGGYIDRFGNVWRQGPSRTPGQPFEWDVQLSKTGKKQLGEFTRDGTHANVSLDGKITHK